ncbi:histidine kinase dimerization/phosphoacceptor domain -containing protein [bacterium]
MAITMLSSSVALLIACAALIAFDQINYREVIKRKMDTLAEIIGNHCTAALIFDNEDDARATLSILLKAEKYILFAAIYDKNDKIFAKYKIGGVDIQSLSPKPKENGGYFHKDHFVIYRDIVLDQEKIGKVYIQSSLGEIKARFRLNMIIVIFVLLMAILASFLMTARLQGVVSEPILHLAKVSQKISLERDYSIRAQKSSEDELGFLTEQFNEMLKQIQNQNIALQNASHDLESRAQQLQEELIQRKKAEEKIKASLEEKEILLKEIHHRVKNNLQVICSLLYLQSKKAKDNEAIEMLKESQNRIKAMALIHEKLYQSEDIVHVDFSEYINSLTSYLIKSYCVNSWDITINKEIGNVEINIDKAIPCGLIINELISNSLKHAFPDASKGEIDIQIDSINSDQVMMHVKDNGIGMPEGIDIKKVNTLGLRLINTLVEQLEGTMEINRNKGTEYNIIFKA